MTDIAIIGYSGRFPGAKSVDEFWRNLCSGKESITFFTAEDLKKTGIRNRTLLNPDYIKASPVLVEDINLFDSEFFHFSAREAAILDPQQRLLLQVAWETLEHSGYASSTHAQNIGFFAGSGGVVTSYLMEYLYINPMVQGATGSFEHLANDKDFVPTRISYKLNLTGPSMAIQTACSTSLLTVHQACLSLAAGECDMAMAGGINVRIPQESGYFRHEGDVYSHDGHIRTFDADASGIVFGSGIGLVMLKKLEDALADGDTVYAVIKGSAVNNDGAEKISYTASSYHGQINCISKAFEKTGIDPTSLSYIEAHGTGTVMGDPVEVSALSEVFKHYDWQPQSCAIGSVKSNVGHLDAAAGITSLIKCLKMMEHRKIPPQINLKKLNPKIDFEHGPFMVHRELNDLKAKNTPLRIGVNSLGIGGTNVFMILEEPPKAPAKKTRSKEQLLLNLSAGNETSLKNLHQSFKECLNDANDSELRDICYTANTGRGQFEYRISVAADTPAKLREQLNQMDLADSKSVSVLPKGFSFKAVFIMGDVSNTTINSLQKLRESNPLYNRMVSKVFNDLGSTANDHFALLAGQLTFWKHLGISPKLIATSVQHLPIAAYTLGYLNGTVAVELFELAKKSDLKSFLASLKKAIHLGAYNTELALLPSGIDVIELLSLESPPSDLGELKRSDGLSLDEYCAAEEFTELLRLENESELKSSLFVHRADEELLTLLSTFYKKGASINWNEYYEQGQYHKVALPTYPFEMEAFWIGRYKRLHMQSADRFWGGVAIHSSAIEENIYQITLSIEEYPILGDHYFFEYPMIAASALVSWITEIAITYYNITSCRVDDFMFMQALMLPSNEHLDIQLIVRPLGDDKYRFSIRSFHEAFLIQDQKWIEHVIGTFSKNTEAAAVRFDDSTILKDETITLDKDEIYSRLYKRGLFLRRAYTCITSVVKSKTEALATLSTRFLHKEGFHWQIHPGIVDALFQVVQCLISESVDPKAIYLLSQWQSLVFHKEWQFADYIYVKVVEQEEGRSLIADVCLLDDKKNILASVKSVRIAKASTMVATAEMLHYQAWQYRLDWRELPALERPQQGLTGKVMVFGDDSGASIELISLFGKNAIQAQQLKYSEFSHEHLPELDPDINALIFMWPIDCDNLVTAQSVSDQIEKVCGSLLTITQKYYNSKAPIYIVTRGGIGTNNTMSHVNSLQGALWGVGRTISVERGQASCVLIDLDPDLPITGQIPLLYGLIGTRPEEQQVAIRQNKLWIPRLDYYHEGQTPLVDINFMKPFAIEHQQGATLEWVAQTIHEDTPADPEVTIQLLATGLAYRDYLCHMGMTKDLHMGDDYVGRVVACGKKVTNVQVGDMVFGLHQGTLRSSITTKANQIAKLTAPINTDQVALWPLVYLTAYYALDKITSLTQQQTILITGASSGVGFAALQIAKRRKAKIIATVNGADKQQFLRSIGIEQVINMAESTWQNDLSIALNKSSIDVILAGTHKNMTESAAAFLSKDSFILDLSGGGLDYSPAIKEHKGYSPIHMYEVIREDNKFVQKAFTDLNQYFSSNEFQAMPYRSYSISRLSDALKALSNPNRINKVLLRHEENATSLFNLEASYMVVGALGALGAFFIPWLIKNGAGTICLVDIQEKNEKVLNTIKQRFGKHHNMEYYSCDITNGDSVKDLFQKIAQDKSKLKGIFNIATMLQDAPIAKQELTKLYQILQVKSVGSQNLHLESLGCDLDHFVMFSSIASMMGSQNQFNYSAANSYQDALAHHRHQLGLPGLAINWSPWRVGIGAYMGANAAKIWKSWGSYMLDPEHDLESLKYLLTVSIPQVALFAIDWNQFISQFEHVPSYLKLLEERFLKGAVLEESTNDFLSELGARSKPKAISAINEFLQEALASCLQVNKDQIGIEDPFSNFGIDSMTSITVRDHLQNKLGKKLPAMIMFSHPKISLITEFIIENFVVFTAAVSTSKVESPKILSGDDVDDLLNSILD